MFIADMKNHIIHDQSFVRYECKMKDIPKEDQKKIFSIQTVKRMVDMSAVPRFNGCPYCLSEYHTFDFQKIFK